MQRKPKLTFEVLVRMVADALMINSALAAGFILDYFLQASIYHRLPQTGTLVDYLSSFTDGFWILTPICLTIFYVTGFYTKGRAYSSRYKVLIVAQAVTLSFLVFGFLNYFLRLSNFPRGVFVVSWFLALPLLVGARIWARLWTLVVWKEREFPPETHKTAGVRSVLLIGGAGYIGSALLPRLLDKGYRVRLADLFIYGSDAIAGVVKHPNLEIVRADFRHVDRVVECMKGMDAVIHLGAIVGDPACALDGELTIETNLLATRFIAEVAKGHGISRFIFASTCSVYGASDQVLDERSALNPVSLYARSKIASEKVLIALGDAKFTPVILRFGTVYGLSGRTRFDLVVNLLTAKALMDGKITVFNPSQWRPFVHVDDAGRALQTALEARSELLSDGIFNVGSEEQNMTLGDLGALIKSLVPAAELICAETEGERRNYRVSFRRIREILGFMPEWTVEMGIRQVMDAILGKKVVNYRDARYSNAKFLSAEGFETLRVQGDWVRELLTPEQMSRPTVIIGSAFKA